MSTVQKEERQMLVEFERDAAKVLRSAKILFVLTSDDKQMEKLTNRIILLQQVLKDISTALANKDE